MKFNITASSWPWLFLLGVTGPLVKLNCHAYTARNKNAGLAFVDDGKNSQRRQRRRNQHHRLLQDFGNIFDDDEYQYIIPKPNGDDECPCLSLEELSTTTLAAGSAAPASSSSFTSGAVSFQPENDSFNIYSVENSSNEAVNGEQVDSDSVTSTTLIESIFGPDTDLTTYGLNCAPHDVTTQQCMNAPECGSVIPVPPDCDKSWCRRSFCYVDPNNCNLLNRPSEYFQDRYFSYATCGNMDSFTYKKRIKSLNGKTFQVGYASNSGGWKGSYNPHGSFAIDDEWHGPIASFIEEVAVEGGVTLNVTRPPEWLKNQSHRFFGKSNFDYCVYATALGYLDFCVGGFSINPKRAAVANFFEMSTEPVYLITFVQEDGTSFEDIWKLSMTIFQPFTFGSWVVILCLLPLLGLIMLFHEYSVPGSAFPSETNVVVKDPQTGEIGVEQRKIPFYEHWIKSCYMSYLSFFTGGYDPAVMTMGGKINLLAIASLLLLVMAVYTANLAAILTQSVSSE